MIADARPYRPGAFCEREPPCILAVLAFVRTPLRAVLVAPRFDRVAPCRQPGARQHSPKGFAQHGQR